MSKTLDGEVEVDVEDAGSVRNELDGEGGMVDALADAVFGPDE